MEQVFRIEIPVEVTNKSDTAALKSLETTLQKIFAAMKQNKNAASEVFSAIERGANTAKAGMDKVAGEADKVSESYQDIAQAADDAGEKQGQASESAASASEKLESTVSEVADAYQETAQAASDAGRKSGSAFTQAGTSADKFTQRIEKSNKTLSQMFREKAKLVIAAIDKASPVIKTVMGSVRGLVGRAWHVAVRMTDFVTAPFQKLYRMISNPITVALSIAGIGMGANEIVNTYKDFETGMSAVKALTGATGEEFAMLKQTAKDLGAATTFSASEASQGMQYLAMSGWRTNQIMAAMPGLLDLAAAGSTDLAVAADITASVMQAMGMSADEAGRAADIFAKTATSSNTTIETLGDTLKYAAPIAHSFGLSLEEVSALAGMMGNAGIKGSMAGTAIRSSLMSMAAPTAEASKLMKQLGISFSNTDGSMKDMGVIVRDLQSKFGTLTQAQKLAYTETLFGTYASSAWLGVIDQGADTFDNFQQSLEGSAGAAKEMAAIRLDNLAGDMEELGGAIETAKLELMEKLDPYIRGAIQWLTTKIPAVQRAIEKAVDVVITKVKAIKEHLTGVFNSDEFKNADGFAEKFFVAWDKIIAEPFSAWWNGAGKGKVLDIVGKMGKTMGDMLHGIVKGVFAALKGEEIDIEGMNLTGIAKAAAEAAKAFVQAFKEALNIGGLLGDMPGGLKAGLFGFGALKVGQGVYGVTKTVSTLKTLFTGTAGAATKATVATAGVGKAAATAGVGVAKAGGALTVIKGALSAIPGWGWAAAIALVATGAAVKLVGDAQERKRKELLHFTDDISASSQAYKKNAQSLVEYSKAISGVEDKTVDFRAQFQPLTEADKKSIGDMVAEMEKNRINLELQLANGGKLSEAERLKLTAEILTLEAQKVSLVLTLKPATDEEKQAVITQINDLNLLKIDIQAQIDGGSLTPLEETALRAQIATIELTKITLKAAIGAITPEEIQTLKTALTTIETNKISIQALINGGGLPDSEVAALNAQIDDLNKREVLIKATLGSLSDEEIAAFASSQLGIDYAKIIELSGGRVTQADVDAGRVTQEYLQNDLDQRRFQLETDLIARENAIREKEAQISEVLAQRDKYAGTRDEYEAMGDDAFSTITYLNELNNQRIRYIEEYKAGNLTDDQLFEKGVEMKADIVARYGEMGLFNTAGFTPDMFFGGYEGGILGFGAKYKVKDTDPLGSTMEWFQDQRDRWNTGLGTAQGNYAAQDQQLVNFYGEKKQAITDRAFLGSDYMGMSLEDIAKNYGQLDEAGRKMFEDATKALQTLNGETGYITEEQKTKAIDIADIAAKAEVMTQVKTQVQTIAAEYLSMDKAQQETFQASGEGAKQLQQVNAALEEIGADKIESLSQINEALATLEGVDLSSFSLEQAQKAFVTLGGDATGAKTNVDNLRSALQSLDGTTATVTINQITNTGGTGVPQNANGGIYNNAFLSLVAEDGPEAIIPLSTQRRERGLELWMRAGEMMGVNMFAQGGIAAPYAGMVERLPESGSGETYKPLSTGNGTGGGGYQISVTANPSFQIDGAKSPEEILALLKAKQRELAEIFGGAIADQLEDILTNTV